MSEITLSTINNIIVVDSRILAEYQGTEHSNFIELIYKYQAKLEAKFGNIRFKKGTSKPNKNGACHEIKYVLLTEDQALAILSLSRNTDRVVDLKFELVEKFQTQKRLLEDSTDRELRAVIHREQQKALPTRSEVRPIITTESQIFSVFCHGRSYPVCKVHDYITSALTGMTAKKLREIGWVDGEPSIGLNHIVNLETLLLVSTTKLHFVRLKRVKGVDETWQQRADRAISKAKSEAN